MTQEFMTAEETDRYVDDRIRRAMHPKRSIVGRVWGLITALLWLVLIGLVIAVFAFAARVQYGLPIPLPSSMVSTAAVTFSTAAAPLPTARQVPAGGAPPAAPAPPSDQGAAPWPTLTPEQPAPTQEVAPVIVVQPNLAPSSPQSNPGFTCGVEPGMDPNATCDPDEGAQSLSIPKAGPRHVGERGSEKVGPGGGE